MKRAVISSFLFTLLFVGIASASYISLTTTISDITIEDIVQTNVKLMNSGDEAAFNLHVSLLLPDGFKSDEISVARLDANASFEKNISITRIKEISPGRYPIVVMTEYTDANGYLLSAISHTSLIYKTSTTSKVTGSISELALEGKSIKKLEVTLRNLDDTTHEVKVELFLPRELKTANSEKTFLLVTKEEKNVEFDVSNLAALEGSSYVILASLEYEDRLHYSSFASGIIKIEKKEEIFSLNNLILVLTGIIILFIYYEARRILKRKSK